MTECTSSTNEMYGGAGQPPPNDSWQHSSRYMVDALIKLTTSGTNIWVIVMDSPRRMGRSGDGAGPLTFETMSDDLGATPSIMFAIGPRICL